MMSFEAVRNRSFLLPIFFFVVEIAMLGIDSWQFIGLDLAKCKLQALN